MTALKMPSKAFLFNKVVSAAVLLGAAMCNADDSERKSPVERGKYLVHHVAMCVQCHTPRDDNGNFLRRRLLQGARMPVKSPYPTQQWGFTAPKLAGIPAGWREDDLILFLQTGKPKRQPGPRPPMPPFRMTKEDANAVVAYLNSLE